MDMTLKECNHGRYMQKKEEYVKYEREIFDLCMGKMQEMRSKSVTCEKCLILLTVLSGLQDVVGFLDKITFIRT